MARAPTRTCPSCPGCRMPCPARLALLIVIAQPALLA